MSKPRSNAHNLVLFMLTLVFLTFIMLWAKATDQ